MYSFVTEAPSPPPPIQSSFSPPPPPSPPPNPSFPPSPSTHYGKRGGRRVPRTCFYVYYKLPHLHTSTMASSKRPTFPFGTESFSMTVPRKLILGQKCTFSLKGATLGNLEQKTAGQATKWPPTRKPKESRVTSGSGPYML